MSIRANTESKFLLKFLLIGIGCLAFSAWSLYDGLVKFPGQIPRAKAWEELQETFPEADWAPKWREISEEKGWSPKRPKKDESVKAIKGKIVYQWIFLGIGLAVGIPCLLWYLTNKGTWVESTEDGVTSSWGAGFKNSEVTKFDKRKWEKKGIGVIHYEGKDGPKTFVLDDLKYEREAMDQIVCFVEDNIDHEKIVNGLPEAALATKKTAASTATAEPDETSEENDNESNDS